MSNFDHLSQLKDELDTYLPLPQDAINNLREVYRIEWTFHSNAIEGNTLSLLETKMVIEEGLTIGGKQLREHFETLNHSEAIDFVEEHAHKDEPITESTMKDIHYYNDI
ncbi:cell filamentation protein Fic [Chengkuizengella sediminis]|uniref:cell filamentation protein Fic n=1 Tax=Chengkuizengella sediminis TaxID=1885917 RepID=UPI00196A3EAD|nr:cell filamentation protein Fic [Chengkuizengella sediminis]